jgi:hypothetical protein
VGIYIPIVPLSKLVITPWQSLATLTRLALISCAGAIASLQASASRVMTHKYRRCIVVLSINKSVEPNEEQKVLTSGFDQGFTVNTSKRVFRGIS